jgi:hypothetical protein
MILTDLFPIVSIWEVPERGLAETAARHYPPKKQTGMSTVHSQ